MLRGMVVWEGRSMDAIRVPSCYIIRVLHRMKSENGVSPQGGKEGSGPVAARIRFVSWSRSTTIFPICPAAPSHRSPAFIVLRSYAHACSRAADRKPQKAGLYVPQVPRMGAG